MAIALEAGIFILAALVAYAILESPAGQKAMQEAGKGLAEELDKIKEQAQDQSKEKEKDCPCDSCPPPPNAPPPSRLDRVPPSTPHFPCEGDHIHTYYFETNQNPKTCECFYNLKEKVDCIPQVFLPPTR